MSTENFNCFKNNRTEKGSDLLTVFSRPLRTRGSHSITPYLLLAFLLRENSTSSFKIIRREGGGIELSIGQTNKYFASFATVLNVCTNAGRISGGPSANWSAGGCIKAV